LSTALFTPNFLIAIAVSPPVEVTPPAISTAVVKHTGHMGSSSVAIVDRDTGCCQPAFLFLYSTLIARFSSRVEWGTGRYAG
jgi:hypothetical protein